MKAYRCGTDWSGWLDGTDPKVEDGEVRREVCFSDRPIGCKYSKKIFVKNCGPYFIYKLYPTICSHATVLQTECKANILGVVRELIDRTASTCV